MTTIKKIINIDSRFREDFETTHSGDFLVKLNYPLSAVLTMRLDQIEVPNSWYNISKKIKNNTVKLKIDDIEYIYTIPDGNYSFMELKEVLENLESSNNVVFNTNFNLELNVYNNKITLLNKAEKPFSIGFPCSNNSIRTFGWFLGYKYPSYKNSNNYIAENMFNDTNNRYFYLVIEDFNTNINDYIIGNLKESFINDNIIARISVLDNKYNVVSNFNNDSHGTQTRNYTSRANINKLHVKLLDEFGQIMDLNGLDISFTLEFQLFVK